MPRLVFAVEKSSGHVEIVDGVGHPANGAVRTIKALSFFFDGSLGGFIGVVELL